MNTSTKVLLVINECLLEQLDSSLILLLFFAKDTEIEVSINVIGVLHINSSFVVVLCLGKVTVLFFDDAAVADEGIDVIGL